MCRILRCAFVALVSLALSASGATLGLAQIAAYGSAGHPDHQAAAHGQHGHHAHHGVAPAPSDEGSQQTGDHPSKNCCSACTVASPLPRTPDPTVWQVVSRAEYSSLIWFD